MIKNILKKRERGTETPLEFLATILSCWLITIGVCIIVDSFFYIQAGVKTVIWQTLVTIVLIVLLSRRWWLPLAFLGTAAVGIFAAVIFSETAYEIFKSFVDFVKWWLAMLPADSEWNSQTGFYLIHTLVNIGITILLFALVRTTKRSWIVVCVAAAVMLVAFVTGYINYDFWAIPFIVAGVFPLIASGKFHNKNLPNFKNLFGILGEKWLFAVVSTIVAVVVCLSSVTVVFKMGENVRTRYFTNVVSDIQTVTKAYTKEQKNLQISLYDLGLAANRDYVGGSLKKYKSVTLAVTDLTEPTFAKISAFDTFDGYNWKNTFVNTYRVNGPWEKQEGRYLSTTILDDSYHKNTVSNLGLKKRVNVYMVRDSHVFPVLGQAYNFSEDTPNKNQLIFNTNGSLFSFYGQETDFQYSFDTIIYDTKQELLKEQLGYVIPVYGNGTDPLYDPECEFYKFYTQRFENLPVVVDSVIASMGFVTDNYYDKAFRICELFSQQNGFVYTETPPDFIEGDDIILKLFQTKQGHCVYYSTAMIALTRAAGIPSRLAAGFRTINNEITNTQAVDRSQPYAWVECYIPHIGWMAFDPTPNKKAVPINPTGQSGNNGQHGSDVDQDNQTDSEVDEDHQTPGTVLEWDGGPNILLLITVPIAALVLLASLFNVIFSQRFYRLKSVRRRFKDTKRQARFYYRDMLRQFRWLGFGIKRGETIHELTQRTKIVLDERYAKKVNLGINVVEALHYGDTVFDDADMQSIVAARESLEKALAEHNNKAFRVISDGITIIEAIYYGNVTPSDKQIEIIYNAHSALEKELKDKNNVFVYILKRRLLLPVFDFSKKFKGKK